MAEHIAFYQRALYYDIALSRDISREVEFLQAVYQYYCGRPMQSALDIACGPGYYAFALAEQGVSVTGLDLQEEMISLAQSRAELAARPLDWLVADMRDFQLPTPVDMAICMFDSLDALTQNEDIVQHMRTVARNLRPEGLYLIDLTHPRDCNYDRYGSFQYNGQRDGTAVAVTWATNNPQFDLVTGRTRVAVEIAVTENGRTQTIHDEAEERLLHPQEITLLAKLSGAFEIVGWYGDYDLQQPLDYSPNSQRMLAVMQKVAS